MASNRRKVGFAEAMGREAASLGQSLSTKPKFRERQARRRALSLDTQIISLVTVLFGLVTISIRWFLGAVARWHGSKQSFDELASAPYLDPLAFERHVADGLNELGWSARTTPASGDKGADVLAEKLGIRVAVQCKLQGNPVGIEAVQQVVSARLHYRTDIAVVVSSSGYTRSAETVAQTNAVMLLGPHSISELDRVANNMAANKHRAVSRSR